MLRRLPAPRQGAVRRSRHRHPVHRRERVRRLRGVRGGVPAPSLTDLEQAGRRGHGVLQVRPVPRHRGRSPVRRDVPVGRARATSRGASDERPGRRLGGAHPARRPHAASRRQRRDRPVPSRLRRRQGHRHAHRLGRARAGHRPVFSRQPAHVHDGPLLRNARADVRKGHGLLGVAAHAPGPLVHLQRHGRQLDARSSSTRASTASSSEAPQTSRSTCGSRTARQSCAPAGDLWGKDVFAVQELLKERHGEAAQVICIGAAGENRVVSATIHHRQKNCAGMAGFGAVMGAKNLKAIVIRGTGCRADRRPRALRRGLQARPPARARRAHGDAGAHEDGPYEHPVRARLPVRLRDALARRRPEAARRRGEAQEHLRHVQRRGLRGRLELVPVPHAGDRGAVRRRAAHARRRRPGQAGRRRAAAAHRDPRALGLVVPHAALLVPRLPRSRRQRDRGPRASADGAGLLARAVPHDRLPRGPRRSAGRRTAAGLRAARSAGRREEDRALARADVGVPVAP